MVCGMRAGVALRQFVVRRMRAFGPYPRPKGRGLNENGIAFGDAYFMLDAGSSPA